ncbi:MAG: methylenetetrahydrofolate reductase [NAD(P)H], partial [Comamonadaceae bacterium]
ASIRAFGTDVVGQMCQDLLDEGVPGLHFYTLNQSDAIMGIYRQLDLSHS